ncbi:hypothetical protein JCM25156A_28940 [Komagataeibacter kakiaceti JCM 25156]
MSAKSTAAQNTKTATVGTEATGGVVEHLVEKFDEVMDAEAKPPRRRPYRLRWSCCQKGMRAACPMTA